MKTAYGLMLALVPLLCHGGEPTERPVWFPLGTTSLVGRITTPPKDRYGTAEVYQEHDRLTVQSNVLELVQEPRWFWGSQPPPDALRDIPLTNQGASLSLQIQPTDSPNILQFVLTLTARERTVHREVEHRWTNIIPFLFTFVVDGKPIAPNRPISWEKLGGPHGMIALVGKGDRMSWTLRVDGNSITSAAGESPFKTLVVDAAFSEYQHDWPSTFRRAKDAGGTPIVIRSNEVTLAFDGKSWKTTEDR
ncbi:MAG: hypothetical protein AAB393_09380 [Bacteroidota bacterium]